MWCLFQDLSYRARAGIARGEAHIKKLPGPIRTSLLTTLQRRMPPGRKRRNLVPAEGPPMLR